MDEHHDRFEQADQRREGVFDRVGGEDWHTACSVAAAVAEPEHPLGLHGIVSAVAPRVAPEQAPRGENEAAPYAVGTDRFHRIARAGWLVLAAPRKRRR